MSGIIEFIKEHWVAYLIGAVLAVALGLGAAMLIFRIGSTSDSEISTSENTTNTGSSSFTRLMLIDVDELKNPLDYFA